MEKIKQWLASKLHPEYTPSEDEINTWRERYKQEAEDNFYANLDIQALFQEAEAGGLLQYAGVGSLIVSVITLIVLIMK